MKRDEEFENYLQNAKEDFCNKINSMEWNTELRTESESFVIAFDQLFDKYKEIFKLETNNLI